MSLPKTNPRVPHCCRSSSPQLTRLFPFLGKNWHATKKAFRPTAGLTSYAKRQEVRKQHEANKDREREMKEEKEAERQVRSIPEVSCFDSVTQQYSRLCWSFPLCIPTIFPPRSPNASPTPRFLSMW